MVDGLAEILDVTLERCRRFRHGLGEKRLPPVGARNTPLSSLVRGSCKNSCACVHGYMSDNLCLRYTWASCISRVLCTFNKVAHRVVFPTASIAPTVPYQKHYSGRVLVVCHRGGVYNNLVGNCYDAAGSDIGTRRDSRILGYHPWHCTPQPCASPPPYSQAHRHMCTQVHTDSQTGTHGITHMHMHTLHHTIDTLPYAHVRTDTQMHTDELCESCCAMFTFRKVRHPYSLVGDRQEQPLQRLQIQSFYVFCVQ